MIGAYATLRDCLRAEEPVALATVVAVTPGEPGEEAGPMALGAVRGESEGAVSAPIGAEVDVAAVIRLGSKIVVRPGIAPSGTFGHPDLDRSVIRDVEAALDSATSATRHYGPHGQARRTDVTVFIEVFAPPRRMVIFGAVDFTASLVKVAKILNYRVTVCDARPVFATTARFREADEVVVDWPDRYLAKVAGQLGPQDAICVLTHDHKFDVPALAAALQTRVGYIGAMGSRHTHEGRVERLRQAGVDDAGLSRLMAPIGIDIGGRTPEETAVSICAEIISMRAGVPVASLRDGTGPIHRAS